MGVYRMLECGCEIWQILIGFSVEGCGVSSAECHVYLVAVNYVVSNCSVVTTEHDKYDLNNVIRSIALSINIECLRIV